MKMDTIGCNELIHNRNIATLFKSILYSENTNAV